MAPSLPAENVSDLLARNAEAARNLILRHAPGAHVKDLAHVDFRELRPMRLLAGLAFGHAAPQIRIASSRVIVSANDPRRVRLKDHSAAPTCVADVFLLRPRPKMSWVHAEPVVAAVQDVQGRFEVELASEP